MDNGSKLSKILKIEPGKLPPLIVNFEHASSVKPEAFSSFHTNINLENSKVDLSMDTNHLTYKSISNLNETKSFTKTYLAIRNRKTNKIRLVESKELKIRAEVNPPKSSNHILLKYGEGEKITDESENRKRRAEMNKHLIREFGQLKGRRFYEQADRMHVESEVLSDKLKVAASNVEENKLLIADQPEVSGNMKLIPPRNDSATHVSAVYDIKQILSELELGNLLESAQNLRGNYNCAEGIKEAIGKKEISELLAGALIKDLKKADDQKLAVALYAEAIVKFYRLRPMDIKKGPIKALPAFLPNSVKLKIFNEFLQNGGVTPESRDKAVCYVIVCALIANDFLLNYSSLISSLRIKADQLKKLVQVSGATFVTDPVTDQSTILLKLPLTSFDVNKIYRKKKK